MSRLLDKNAFDAALVPGVRELMSSDYAQLRRAEKKMTDEIVGCHDHRPALLSKERDCVLCGTSRENSRLRYRVHGLSIVTCRRCGMTYSRNILEEEADRERYVNSAVPRLHQALRANSAYSSLEAKKAAYLANRLTSASPRKGRLLDIGCSTGVFMDAARSLGWAVYGVEANRDLAEVARGRNLNLAVGFYPEVLPPDYKTDAIALLDVLEHAADPMTLLSSVRSHLNPGGRVLVQVPNFDSLIIRLEGAGNSNLGIGHWSYFTPSTLDQMLARAGFRSLGSETIISEIDKIRAFPWTKIENVLEEIGILPPLREDQLTVERLHALGMGYKATGIYQLID